MCGLLVLFAGLATVCVPRFCARMRASQSTGRPVSPAFAALMRKGGELFAQAQYIRAAETFDQLSRAAQAARDYRMAARADANYGACRYALHQYQPA